MHECKGFWDKNAARYDRFMRPSFHGWLPQQKFNII